MTTQAQTRFGLLDGQKRSGHVAFRGIPFAKPPIGRLRFKPPEEPDPWTSVKNAHEFGPSAIQGSALARGTLPEGPESEDCLYLNVYTPAVDGKRRPVLFWIHGGAFITGSAGMPLYDGGHLAERGDVVVVTANYRIGALGFLHPGERGAALGATANAGILDQILALEWVSGNIEHFGGDPTNVTIFGESAGATSVAVLLVAPKARGLFHKAICESAAPPLVLAEPKRAEAVRAEIMTTLGIAPADIERLWDVDAKELIAAQASVERGATSWRGFFPVADPSTLPENPQDAFVTGRLPRIPLIVGTNRDEWNLFLGAALFEIDNPMEDDEAVAAMGKLSLPDVPEPKRRAILETYRAARTEKGLRHGNRALLSAIHGDHIFRIASLRFLEGYRAVDRRTFSYLFTHESPAVGGFLGSCHALEIPFVFGTLEAPLQDRFAGEGPAVRALSDNMMDAWLAFAKTGDPNHPGIDPWPVYEPDRRATMVFGPEIRVENAPHEAERAAWNGIA